MNHVSPSVEFRNGGFQGAAGPFAHHDPAAGYPKPKRHPERSRCRHFVVDCGHKPGNRRAVLVPATTIVRGAF